MTEGPRDASWNVAEWHGTMLVDRQGERIGKLQDVYIDVENDEPQFATVKEGVIGRHLTFVPLSGITIDPDDLQQLGAVEGKVEQEVHACQVELITNVCAGARDTALALAQMRRAVLDTGTGLLASATHPWPARVMP